MILSVSMQKNCTSWVPTCDPGKVVINLSNYSLSKKEKFLLAFGLEHCLQPRFSKLKYFAAFETLFNRVKDLPFYNTSNLDFGTKLKNIAHKFLSKSMRESVHTIFSDKDKEVLKKLGKNNNLHITRPDKGRGVVIMNKIDYINKVANILSDPATFENLPHDDPKTKTLKLEDKINRNLKKLKDNNNITEEEYKNLYATGTSPGIMYGLPKIHKQGIPVRPILSSTNNPNYRLAKFLIPHINHLSINDYTLKNSKEFFDYISNINLPNNSVMASFDIVSLYTNIPIKETVEIITNSIYENDNSFRNLTKKNFKNLLKLVTEDNYFIFNNKYLKQIEGLSMGNPISATFANIFMSFHEQQWLSKYFKNFNL